MSASDVVKAAAAKGIKLTDKFVHTIRYNAKKSAARKAGRAGGSLGRRAARGANGAAGHGLQAEIERIVERKVNALLSEKLGALFGRG